MRLASVTRARNECDIIEAFVRHNAAYLDRLYIVDNCSSDATPEILRRLAAEGLPLVIGTDDEISQYQGRKTTELCQRAIADEAWDFVFPLDADEFLQVADRSSLEASLEQLSSSGAPLPGILSIVQYVSTDGDNQSEPDVLRRIGVHTDVTPKFPPVAGKVVIPRLFAKEPSLSIAEGNHYIKIFDKDLLTQILTPVRLAHYSIRSHEQFISRAVVGHLSWMSRTDYRTLWDSNYLEVCNEIKLNSQAITADHLIKAAFHNTFTYLPPEARSAQARLIRDPLTPAYDRLRYTDLIKIDVLARVVDTAERLAKELRLARSPAKSGE
jgi:glycosyltransferase involved in cell wall biosynthesis